MEDRLIRITAAIVITAAITTAATKFEHAFSRFQPFPDCNGSLAFVGCALAERFGEGVESGFVA